MAWRERPVAVAALADARELIFRPKFRRAIAFLFGEVEIGNLFVHELVEELELPIRPYDSAGRVASPFYEKDGRICYYIIGKADEQTRAIQTVRQVWSGLRHRLSGTP